jgi:predicted glutamine amidotransferase
MCRWMAYSGNSFAIEELIFETEYSLIDQSLSARMAPKPTNGDGFGLGWYGRDGEPGVYRSVQPAWNDANLRDIAHHIESEIFVAHVRRATGTPVQQTNCHPFRHGQWLFVHNGLIYGYEKIRREMTLAVDPSLFPGIAGSSDSELMFHLALTFGLEEDPIGALERTVGLVEKLARGAGIEHPVQMTIWLSNGAHVYSVRYSSVGDSRTLFYTTDIADLRQLYPDNERLEILSDQSRVITSEPTSDLEGVWNMVPEATALVVHGEELELRPFKPREPHA